MKRLYTVVFILGTTCLSVLLSSCQSPTLSEFAAKRMIAIDSEGAPQLYPVKQKNGTILSPEENNYQKHLNNIVDSIRKSGRKKIMIFVYGGMSNADRTAQTTEELSRIISENSDYYPIFISWESSLFDAYFDHMLFIRRGYKSYVFGPVLSPFYLVGDIVRATVRLPINLFYQSYGILYKDYSQPYINEENVLKLKQNKVQFSVGRDMRSQFEITASNLVYVFCFPFRILTTPLIDTYGTSAWKVMKRRARTAFVLPHKLEISEDKEIAVSLSPPDGALSLLMNSISELCQQDKSYSIDLYGYSMGPLLVNEIIKRYPNLTYRNIIYLVSACSIKETVDSVVPYLESNPKSSFYNLCLHPNADIKNAMFYFGLPRGSILNWIDLYFATPVSPSDHTVGTWLNAILELPRRTTHVREQVKIKAFGLRDPESNNKVIDMPEYHTDIVKPVLKFWTPEFRDIPNN